MQHLGTNTGSSGPHSGKKKHTVFVHIPPMTGTEVSRGLGIPTSVGNLVSHVCTVGNGNMSLALTG